MKKYPHILFIKIYNTLFIVVHPWFDNCIAGFVIINTGFLCIQHHGQSEVTSSFIRISFMIFTLIFLLEIAVKATGVWFLIFYH